MKKPKGVTPETWNGEILNELEGVSSEIDLNVANKRTMTLEELGRIQRRLDSILTELSEVLPV